MALLERTPLASIDLRVIEASDGGDVLSALLGEAPDVVVVDIEPGAIHPLQLCREVAERSPVTRVVVRATAEQAAHSYQALRVGAWGCLDADAGPGDLHDAAEAAARGEALLPPRHAAWVLRELDDGGEVPAGAPPTPDRLTATERTVLRLLAEGAAPEAVADHLGVSPRVVRRHAGSALARLHRRYRRPSDRIAPTA